MPDPRPESPLAKLARVLGGVVLLQGRLGHQVLGQMLITNVTQSEIAGATLAVSAGSRRRSLLAQTAVGLAAPALAVQAMVDKQDRRLTRRESEVARREKEVKRAALPAGAVRPEEAEIIGELREEVRRLRQANANAEAQIAALRRDKRALEASLAERIRAHLAEQSAAERRRGDDE